ncbi:MAG: M24 family metallopeptidase [Rhodospirillales bacterium]|nr:M24 family metallopeptidase [Rhodospirillales bacterium]
MKLPFTDTEFKTRVERVRKDMQGAGVELLLVSDPNNIYWLTGAEDWAFYVPQFVLVSADDPMPTWYGRAMDRPGALLSTWLDNAHVAAYAESYVQKTDCHPSEALSAYIKDTHPGVKRVGYESDTYYFSPRSLQCLIDGLPDATFVDCDLLVNRARLRKSPAEIAYMRNASEIASATMSHAMELIEPGVRQSDVMAEVFKTQIAFNGRFGGSVTGLSPIILAGEKASTAHPAWTDDPFEEGQTIALELGGSCRRYCCGLARTMHLGRDLPADVTSTAKAVNEGMEKVLETMRPGVVAGEVHGAWQKVLDNYGLTKESRIGYGIGIGFPPDWGERAVSLRQEDTTELEPGMTFHIILGMWMDGWGLELSETVHITADGSECLTNFSRELVQKYS